jgi:hypothetical protein
MSHESMRSDAIYNVEFAGSLGIRNETAARSFLLTPAEKAACPSCIVRLAGPFDGLESTNRFRRDARHLGPRIVSNVRVKGRRS